MYYQPFTTPYLVQQTKHRKISPADAIQNQKLFKNDSLKSFQNQVQFQKQSQKMNQTSFHSLNNSFQQLPRNDSFEKVNRSMTFMDNISEKQPQIFYKKKPQALQNKENTLNQNINSLDKQIQINKQIPSVELSKDYLIQQQQQEIEQLRNKVLTQSEKNKMLKLQNEQILEESRQIEFQRDTIHNQLFKMQEQFQRDIFNSHQHIQQLMIDRQFYEKLNKELLQENETLRVSAVIKSATEQLPQEQDQIFFQGQLIEIEQENYNLRQEIREMKEELQSVQLKYQKENYDIEIERENLKKEQEKLLRLSDELLLEASTLKQSELDQKDPQNQMLNQWRNFLIDRFSQEFQIQQKELQKQIQQSPVNLNRESQKSIIDKSSRLYCIIIKLIKQDTKQAYQKLNRLAMSSAGMLSFKMNYKKEVNHDRLNQIKLEIEKLRI